MNVTYIGNAVFMSMDIPDSFFAVRHFKFCFACLRRMTNGPVPAVFKIAQLHTMEHRESLLVRNFLCYLVVSAMILPLEPSTKVDPRYFRHYLNLRILWSVWFELPSFIP